MSVELLRCGWLCCDNIYALLCQTKLICVCIGALINLKTETKANNKGVRQVNRINCGTTVAAVMNNDRRVERACAVCKRKTQSVKISSIYFSDFLQIFYKIYI